MSGLLYLEIPGTKKSIDDKYVNVYNAKNINFLNLFYTSESTFIYLGINNNSEYYIVEEGNKYTVFFPTKDNEYLPPISQVPQEPVEPQIPVNPNPIYEHSNYELIIPNPAGLSGNMIKHEDQYNKLRFIIRIPGDYTSFIAASTIQVNSDVIKDVSVFLNSSNETEILVSTSVLQGYEISADANYIYVNIGNPRDIYKNIVVLDPGHGGPAPGARYFNTNEKNINLKILYEIGKEFFNSNTSQLKVYYTRESDVDLSLADRAAFADRIGADLFISLHMNANTNKSVYGTEVYYSSNNNKRNQAGLNSETLAKLFVNCLSSDLNTNNRGTRAAKYTVVHKNTVPAILVELGFMSNKNDFAKISDPAFQYEAARALYETVLQVFETYPTGR
jgi:N-acetylmuramoyl-L-alanine amidase